MITDNLSRIGEEKMKPRSRNMLLSVLCILAVLLLSACGTATPEANTAAPATAAPATAAPATAAPAVVATAAQSALPAVLKMPAQIAGGKPVTISVVGRPPDSQASLLAAWSLSVARFEKLYPNVTIEGSDYSYTPDSFPALVAGNQVPTLFQVYVNDPDKMIAQGVAADLTSFYQAQGLDKVYNSTVLSLVSRNGKNYAIPMDAYAMGLGYNMKMLKDAGYTAPPKTWDELATMAQKLTNRDAGVSGFAMITGDAHQAGWHTTVLAYNFGLNGTDLVTGEKGNYKEGWGTSAPLLSALQFINDLRWKYDVLPREGLVWDTNNTAFANGQSAMTLMAGDVFTWIKSTYPDADMSQLGYAPFPAGPSGKSVSLIGGNIAMVSAKASPEQIEAAAYFRLWYQLDPNEIVTRFEAGKSDPTAVVGAPNLPLFTGDYQTQTAALEKQYANLPVDNYKLYKDAFASGASAVMPEPGVAGQDYYAALGTLVSEIVTKQGVDIPAALAAAAQTFQTNILDKMQ
jgi:ABC-type glycerol-3-phosphate transport system substrate-binding protein